MKRITAPPDPARTIEGLRDTGYDFNTAVADLIDNSIAAGATMVDVRIEMDFEGNILLSIADNGHGMDPDFLIEAMRYGSPVRPSPRSLGKFGLGMKTASTAFSRQLSVVSRNGSGECEKAVWDLDHVADVGEWELLIDEPNEDETNHLNSVAGSGAGTVVRWQKVDRLLKDYVHPGGRHARRALDRYVDSLREHAAMVYQRFLDESDEREQHKVRIWIKGEELQPWDPFCSAESELVLEETVPVGHEDADDVIGTFTVRAFVLPRKGEYSSEEAEQRARLSNANQGIYIYRENRLIHSADWLGMYAKEPHSTLLRVEFSFDATLDEFLQVDIKKSKIVLNEGLYEWLKDEFLPAPRRAAQQRYRKGKREEAREAAEGAHSSSNANIQNKEKDIDQAQVTVVDADTGEVAVTNPQGTSRLRLKIGSATRPGEVYVQPVDSIDDGLLWEPALIDNHQAVQINSGHEFYRKVYIPNIVSSEGSVVNVEGMDALLWALAVAELKAVSDTTKDHLQELRYQVSRILRKLVENLPEPPDAEGDE